MPSTPVSNSSWHSDQGTQEVVVDKNGVSRRVSRNLNAKQDDALRYQREKQGEEVAQQTGGYQNTEGGTTQLSGSAGAAPSAPQGASTPSVSQDWLIGLQQAYSSEYPMRLDLDPNSPIVTADMLNPAPEQLQAMNSDQREALGRVFLAIASKILGDNTLSNALLAGTKIKGYVPGMVLKHFHYLSGR